jgi:leucyl/phenylalanyl-tRNA--protein transferase
LRVSTWPTGPPVELPATRWQFPTSTTEVGTVLAAYRAGLFPMPVRRRTLGWFSPDPRGILPLDGLAVSRSLRRATARYEIRVDTAFEDVIGACADPRRPGAWIDREVRRAYVKLHSLGWAHSVEAWDDQGLAGGLYGLAIGGLFAGESMFHHRTDASKVALVGLVERLRAGGATLLDVQWTSGPWGSSRCPGSATTSCWARRWDRAQLPLSEASGLTGHR